MIFSYSWLKDYVKNLPKPEKVAELLTRHSFEVGEVKKVKGDWTLDIDVLPNRASDCFSHWGVAREIVAITNLKFRGPTSTKFVRGRTSADSVSVEVKDRIACPRYTVKVLTDVRVGPSPKWLSERLEVCGLNSINNIVDVANYVMLETGQPLHAFDGKKLSGQKIIVRFAKKGEKITTLDGQKFNLDAGVLVIADAHDPIAIAGIKGGKFPEISKSTKVVILESANFNPQTIRRGSQKLNLKTDASIRFEHGLDPNLTESAINRAAQLIQELAGGQIAKGLIDVYPQKTYPKRIKLNLDYVESLLGVKIPEREMKNILKSLNFKFHESRTREIMVEIPTRRLDILIPEDLIEEIGRVYGYDKILSTFPIAALVPPRRNEEIFWEDMAKNILKEAGFTEVYNYSFIGDREVGIFNFKDSIELKNPISLEQRYLRPSLIPNLLKNVEKNSISFSEIKIFELGKIFRMPKSEEKILTGVITGDAFYQAKGLVDALLNKLGISDIWYDEYRTLAQEKAIAFWHPQKAAEIKVGQERVGFLGEISPRILNEFKIKSKIIYFDIFFEKLVRLASEEHEYRPLSKFPSAVRDLAVLVPRGTKVVEVLNKINAAGGKLVRDVDLFDIYEGEEMPEGKKNLAFHIVYQAEDRTLRAKEVDEIHQKIIKTLEKEPTWQVRK